MAAHHDHHHPATQSKPVAFTVPFILAAVVLVIIMLFLSLCDPTPHGHGNAAGHEQGSEGHRHATDQNNVQSHGEAKGPDAVPERERTGTAGQD